MEQMALPLEPAGVSARIVIGDANRAAVEALAYPENWPFHTAILVGPPRSGKSSLANWFRHEGQGDVIDDAHLYDETALFHCWNRAQETGRTLLLTAPEGAWNIALPDLASRLGAAMHLMLGAPDDAMLADLIIAHAEARCLPLGEDALRYLVTRLDRSHLAAERLVAIMDRLSFERKTAPGLAIWREALKELADDGGRV